MGSSTVPRITISVDMHKDTYELLQKLKERHKSEMLRYTKRDTPGDS